MTCVCHLHITVQLPPANITLTERGDGKGVEYLHRVERLTVCSLTPYLPSAARRHCVG
jgi:hypothetical protein